MPRVHIAVNPKVLVWARETTGLALDDAAQKLAQTPDRLRGWEDGSESPTEAQLEKLGTVYGRPTAVFLLDTPPVDPPLPRDFRRHRGVIGPLSLKMRLVARRALRLQRIEERLRRNLGLVSSAEVLPRVDVHDDAEQVAATIRQRLGVSIEEQRAFKSPSFALKTWRAAVERMGIVTFQLRMPRGEASGFSLSNGLPVIVLTIHDHEHRRMFTLFHELGHLLLREPGICNTEGSHAGHTPGVERFCDQLAAAILVPLDALRTVAVGLTIPSQASIQDEPLETLGTKFRVSKQVILGRLFTAGRISKQQFQRKLAEWQRPEPEPPEGESAPTRAAADQGHPSSAQWAMWELGPRFISLVFQAHDGGLITESDACDYLSVRLRHLDKLHSRLVGLAG
jgi:Zn-dependent peptidase ImmA (M78 family)